MTTSKISKHTMFLKKHRLDKYTPTGTFFSFNSSMNKCNQSKISAQRLTKKVILPNVKWSGDIALVETLDGMVNAREGDYLILAKYKLGYEKVISEKEYQELRN